MSSARFSAGIARIRPGRVSYSFFFSRAISVCVPTTLSAVRAIIGKPLTDLLSGLHVRRTRFPRSLAALCTLLDDLVVVGVFWLFVPIVFQKIREFSSLDVPQIIQSFQEPLMSLESFIRRVFCRAPG